MGQKDTGGNQESALVHSALARPVHGLDWCLYETGQFRNRILSEKVHKLICLHHPKQKELPPQIDDLQAVKAEKEAMVGFLK